MADVLKKSIIVFLDSGLQKTFFPLCKPEDCPDIPSGLKTPESLQNALDDIEQCKESIPAETQARLKTIFKDAPHNAWCNVRNPKDGEDLQYLKFRFGQKSWHLQKGFEISLNGIWFMVETNTSGQDANGAEGKKYDRGYFFEKDGLNDAEKNGIIQEFRQGTQNYPQGTLHYIDLKAGEILPVSVYAKDIPVGDENVDQAEWSTEKDEQEGEAPKVSVPEIKEIELDFGKMNFELVVRKPGGDVRDVDLMLDLGNTRTAALLFDHQGNDVFQPKNFKQQFRVLRLKPDPRSGEYDSINDVDAGIVQSWIVLHEQEHQTYVTKGLHRPPLLQKYFKLAPDPVEIEKRFLRSKVYHVKGEVHQLIPQMFMQLSPVLLGDQAERAFNLPYARRMIDVGGQLLQSSPKRYYWDDAPRKVYWNMMLNEWDPAYTTDLQSAVELPMLQGEMFRFIHEKGKILDLTDETPDHQPLPYPEKPAYPKQSTLTWFLLHILERAYAQANAAFTEGADFIPHRLRKVLITYPSGWTNQEISRYRERCQEALNIFSQTNIYHGVKSPLKLELVPQEQTPDEAVAGQLPFVFSEIIRYEGLTAGKWISLVGKKRSDIDTVRIMNFDIGGGTTDISVVEYRDKNQSETIAMNLLSANLLFKDGQTIAGDDLVKEIIEKIILGGLIRMRSTDTKLKENIVHQFTQSFSSVRDEAMRSRVIRTCLIPLATKCLMQAGAGDNVQFSAQDAGVNKNNWDEFLEFIGPLDDEISYTEPCFSFRDEQINEIIESRFAQLFQNCAMYAAAYDVDMLIFSGKPSELPYIKTMAKRYIPLDNNRIIFARDFKAGYWYPYTDKDGYIEDAKTVTVVGSALYYALSNDLIAGWQISSESNLAERNEWGELNSMRKSNKIFMAKDADEAVIQLLPNMIIARRQNICSSPEPVYKIIRKDEAQSGAQKTLTLVLKRNLTADGESLELVSVNDSMDEAKNYELKLWPCEQSDGIEFWQETGIFCNID